MHRRSLRSAAVLALASAMATAGLASADGVIGDGNLDLAGRQTTVDLGIVPPGAQVTARVGFDLVCSGTSHPDHGQSVTLTPFMTDLPTGTTVIAFPGAGTGPTPTTWPVDGEACPSPAPAISSDPVDVAFRAPTVENSYVATFAWSRTLTPAGLGDGTALGTSSATAIAFRFQVVADTPPTLVVPADLRVEADTTGGWTADYQVTAIDTEDDPDPTPVCDPAVGEVLPLGTTTISCQVTDTRGQTASDDFEVTVVDTTAPAMLAPADLAIETSDAAGTVVTYTAPAASDIVDPDPVVACAPVSGSLFPVGTTAVSCTATDASGNESTASFDVTVTYVPVVVASASWLDPVGVASGGTFVTNRGRTLPVKVTLAIDGRSRTTGDAVLRLEPCAGGSSTTVPLTFGGGRWNAALDTAPLAGCTLVTAAIDGLDAGFVRLELRGSEVTAMKGRRG